MAISIPGRLKDKNADKERMAANNNVFNLVFFSGSAIIGSISSLFLAVASIWAVFRFVLGDFKLSHNKQLRIAALAFLTYPLSELISTIANLRGFPGVLELGGALLCLSILPVASRLLLNSPQDVAASTGSGAAASGIILVLYCLIELFLHHTQRPEAGLGNANVLAFFSLVITCICLSLVTLVEARLRWFIYFGGFCAFNTMLFTGTRSIWLVTPFALALAAWPVFHARFKPVSRSASIILGAAALGFLTIGMSIVYDRMSETVTSFMHHGVLTTDVSLQHRFFLWQGGFEQVKASWLFGYGPDSAFEMIKILGGTPPLTYSHYHNILLTAAIRGGIIELASVLLIFTAIVWVIVKKPENAHQRAGRSLLASVSLTAFISGMTGSLFTHDITNAVFIYTVIIGLCLRVTQVPVYDQNAQTRISLDLSGAHIT